MCCTIPNGPFVLITLTEKLRSCTNLFRPKYIMPAMTHCLICNQILTVNTLHMHSFTRFLRLRKLYLVRGKIIESYAQAFTFRNHTNQVRTYRSCSMQAETMTVQPAQSAGSKEAFSQRYHKSELQAVVPQSFTEASPESGEIPSGANFSEPDPEVCARSEHLSHSQVSSFDSEFDSGSGRSYSFDSLSSRGSEQIYKSSRAVRSSRVEWNNEFNNTVDHSNIPSRSLSSSNKDSSVSTDNESVTSSIIASINHASAMLPRNEMSSAQSSDPSRKNDRKKNDRKQQNVRLSLPKEEIISKSGIRKQYFKDPKFLHQEVITEHITPQMMDNTSYSHLVVLDFEATCEQKQTAKGQKRTPRWTPEIIEFPAIAVKLPKKYAQAGGSLQAHILPEQCVEFHSYVRPVVNPVLTPFCVALTGIQQQTVSRAPLFMEVWMEFWGWLKDNRIQAPLIVTCGDWDIKTMLRIQAGLVGLDLNASMFPTNRPYFLTSWINQFCNIKRCFNFWEYGDQRNHATSIAEMLRQCDLGEFEGRAHSGIDDCRNILKLVLHYVGQGRYFHATFDYHTFFQFEIWEKPAWAYNLEQ